MDGSQIHANEMVNIRQIDRQMDLKYVHRQMDECKHIDILWNRFMILSHSTHTGYRIAKERKQKQIKMVNKIIVY